MNKFIASYVLFFLRFFFLFLTTNRKHQTQCIKHFVNRIKTRCAGDLEKNNANIKTQKSRGITAAHIIARSSHEL